MDSWGDGWNGADFTITEAGGGAVVASDSLTEGAYGEFPYCVKPGCYSVAARSGEWREELSWQLVELLPGGGAVVRAAGAAPETCGFGLTAGGGEDAACRVGCESRGEAVADDWTNGAGDDDFWNPGWDDASAEYGYYYGDGAGRCDSGDPCGVSDNFAGWEAASNIMGCLDSASPNRARDDPFQPELWEERPDLCYGTYDFGELDEFEDCARRLTATARTIAQKNAMAKECMALLVSAAPDGSEDKVSDDELVKRLATMVYYDGDTGFCDCSSSENSIPDCDDFADFKAVVREAHEACDALDAIDCAYLGAYASACEVSLVNEFGRLDLTDGAQCVYVDETGCGGLAIPSVRSWDCLLEDNFELTADQHKFVLDLVAVCVDDDGPTPAPAPRPAPVTPSATTDDDAAARHVAHKGADDGASGSTVALAVIGSLALAAVAAAGAWAFFTKRYPFGAAAEPAGTELSYSFAPLESSGEYVAPGV